MSIRVNTRTELELGELVFWGRNTLVHRARTLPDDLSVILKTVAANPADRRAKWRLHHEYQALSKLDSPYVIRVLGLTRHRGALGLLLEDGGRESLAQRLGRERPTLDVALRMALQIAHAIEHVHGHHIVHRDLNPNNVVWNEETRTCKLIDFGISSFLRAEARENAPENLLEGTLTHISPEQTGRMNRRVDARSDLYSFGVTLYELFTGVLPHVSADPMTLVHAHLAVEPAAPHDVAPGLPRVLSDLVLKLLRKAPEDRYQTAAGVRADLERCVRALAAGEPLVPFELGQSDVSDMFALPDELFGRDEPRAQLRRAYERVHGGAVEVVVVRGARGIGRSAFLQDTHASLTREGAWVASGRYEASDVAVPYAGIISAFDGLIEHLLRRPNAELQTWRERILAAVGRNGQIVVDLVPSLASVIGPQPPVVEQDGVEGHNRFNLVLGDFVGVFCQQGHPLVLCLDDLQWASPASLAFLKRLATSGVTEGLLLVLAVRDEDEASTAVGKLLAELAEHPVACTSLALQPLDEARVEDLVASTLRARTPATRELASIAWRKTGGNPLFLREFLQNLHDDGILRFDPAAAAFVWSRSRVLQLPVTDDIGALLSSVLGRLPEETQRALECAAVIGASFDLPTLAALCERSPIELAATLQPAVDAGLLEPSEELVDLVEHDDGALGFSGYAFLHARILETAYAALEPETRRRMHALVGRRIVAQADLEHDDRALFEAIRHLDHGSHADLSPEERAELVALNARAAHRAQRTNAYALAIDTLRAAIGHLGPNAWTEAPELALELHCRWAENAARNVAFDDALAVLDEASLHVTSDEDRARLLVVRADVEHAGSRMKEAIRAGLGAAAILGLHVPEDPDEVRQQLRAEIGAMLAWTATAEIESILDLPTMDDPRLSAVMQVLMASIAPAYQSSPELFSLLCAKMVTLSLQHGNHVTSAKGFGSFAIIFGAILGNYDGGYRFGKLGVDLATRMQAHRLLASTHFVHGGFAMAWRRPIDESIAELRRAVEVALATGDHPHAAYAGCFVTMHQLFGGERLDVVRVEAEKHGHLMLRLDAITNIEYMRSTMQLVRFFQGELENDQTLDDATFDETAHHEVVRALGNASLIHHYAVWRLVHRYACGDYEAALVFLDEADGLKAAAPGMIATADQNLFGSLTMTALYESVDSERRAVFDAKLDRHQAELARWAESCPANFAHRHLLVEAERTRLRGDLLGATDLFDRAIALAAEQGFVNIVALAHRLAADLWTRHGRPAFAAPYLRGATDAYTEWGAAGELRRMEERYQQRPTELQDYLGDGRTSSTTSEHLDVGNVIKAARAISNEIVLERLLSQLMSIIFETAGAEAGTLLLNGKHGLTVRAAKRPGEPLDVLSSAPLEDADVCPAIVQYVARCSKPMLLDDAAASPEFGVEPRFRAQLTKSVLCMPIRSKGELVGVLYLENNLVAGAFTEDRLRALDVLTAQVAVSIENATLFEEIQRHAAIITQTNEELRSEIAVRTRAEAELARYRDHLEDLVEQRTQELRSAQSRLIDVSRAAGMAEVATGVLHNVGNVLNSVNVSAELLRQQIDGSSIFQVQRLADLLDTHADDLADFLTRDERGKKVVPFLRLLAEGLMAHEEQLRREAQRLGELVEHVIVVVSKQQDYARATSVVQECTLGTLVDESLALASASHGHVPAEIRLDVDENLRVLVDRHRVLQILVNLLTNAFEALAGTIDRRIVIEAGATGDDRFVLRITDNGVGIAPEDFDKMFRHGFTTKPDGHGFGLHNACNTAKAMGGALTCQSEGPGRGATFILELPLRWSEAMGDAMVAGPHA